MSVWHCLFAAVLLGCCLGLLYAFLRPLRPRWLADLLFIAGLFWIWIYLGFGICGGDLRFGYTAALLGGCLAWEIGFGAVFSPVFSCFWKVIFRIFALILCPFKKIRKKLGKFRKFIFATGKKWVTIECTEHSSTTRSRRKSHGKTQSFSKY